MARNRNNGVSWSDLPLDPLQKIFKSLDTEIDVLRFRAVCSFWRSSTAPFKNSPFANLNLPYPFSSDCVPVPVGTRGGVNLRLTERTVYRVQSPEPNNPKSWLLKTEIAGDGKSRLLNPLNDRPIKILPETPIPKVLNTLNFRVSEICRSYALTLHWASLYNPKQNDECKYANKVAVSFNPESNEYAVLATDERNKLWFIKSGDEKWTLVDKKYHWASSFRDVMYHKGQFYAVDVCGAVYVLDSNLDRTQVSSYLSNDASRRHLIEMYDGELYLVDGVTDKDKRTCKCCGDPDDFPGGCQCRWPNTPVFNTVVELVISRLDRSEGRWGRWVETKTVNDRVIFVGDDCSFALPSKEFKGCDGGRVFYTDEYIFFRTEDEKKVHDYDDYGIGCEEEGDGDYGYNYYDDCDCPGCCGSDDEDVVRHDDFVPLAGVKSKFRELHGHNVGVYDFRSSEIGSLLKFPEYADVFWPPPPWLK